MQYELGVIGAGNMAEAILRGQLKNQAVLPGSIIASAFSEARRQAVRASLGIAVTADNTEIARSAKVILLCVKPQKALPVLREIAPHLPSGALVISIMAGISIATLQRELFGPRVIRTMPNTPMLVGQGMVSITPGTSATPEDIATARRLFSAAAQVIEVREEQIDAVTAVSGSGPAYFYYLTEQMIRTGVDMGLSIEQATQLATQTALGAASMMSQSGEPPAQLRAKVTSPNGTTQAAITAFEAAGLSSIVTTAMNACANRSRELGK